MKSKLLFSLFCIDDVKYQSIEEGGDNKRLNFDGRHSGEQKSVNYSVLSRSKSGDVKVQSNSK